MANTNLFSIFPPEDSDEDPNEHYGDHFLPSSSSDDDETMNNTVPTQIVLTTTEDNETQLKCTNENCTSVISLKQAIMNCDGTTQKDLMGFITDLVLKRQTHVTYRLSSSPDLISACQHLPTESILSVIHHRALTQSDQKAVSIIRDIATAPVINWPIVERQIDGERSHCELVWAYYSESDDIPSKLTPFRIHECLVNFYDDASKRQIKHHQAIMDAIYDTASAIDDLTTTDQLPELATYERNFFAASTSQLSDPSQLIEGALKLCNDALVIEKFLDSVNANYGGLTREEYDAFETGIFQDYKTHEFFHKPEGQPCLEIRRYYLREVHEGTSVNYIRYMSR